jgi:hypothetical protein
MQKKEIDLPIIRLINIKENLKKNKKTLSSAVENVAIALFACTATISLIAIVLIFLIKQNTNSLMLSKIGGVSTICANDWVYYAYTNSCYMVSYRYLLFTIFDHIGATQCTLDRRSTHMRT